MSKILQKSALTRKRKVDESGEIVNLENPQKSQKVVENSSKSTPNESNIIYLGHIPSGFFEIEMRRFFSQFGRIKRLKLYRSKATRNSKGYAFIEFKDNGIAEVVAESMNGYHMFEKKLVCHVVPFEQIHDNMFSRRKRRSEIVDEPQESTTCESTIKSIQNGISKTK